MEILTKSSMVSRGFSVADFVLKFDVKKHVIWIVSMSNLFLISSSLNWEQSGTSLN